MFTTDSSICPMRKEPNHRSEMVSQVLYGESFIILEKQSEFSKIQLDFDQYEGWVANNQIIELDTKPQFLLTIPYLKYKGEILFSGSHTSTKTENTKLGIIEYAKLFLNTPYLWGGRTIAGIDCSGFIQTIYKAKNKIVPRDSGPQSQIGKEIAFKNHQKGDLAFFEENGRITHVGLIIEKNKIIHASGKVRIDDLTKNGIINYHQKMTHILSKICRNNL